MLIICHKDHIIHDLALLCPVIKGRTFCGKVIIHRHNDIVGVAGENQFPQKFEVCRCRLCRYFLKVYIDAIQVITHRCGHQIVDQFGADRSPPQYLLNINVVFLFIEIIDQSPHLHSFCMSRRHVISTGEGRNVSLVVAERKPGR